MGEVKSGQVAVEGATLHYDLRGEGPLVLMFPGGDGDAAANPDLVAQLASRYSVLTYDRRGLSRSTVQAGAPPIDIALHAEDAHRLLAAVGRGPARVLASSIGAVIGLELVARHPEQVRRIVAHEPPAAALLPAPEREAFLQQQSSVEETFRREGIPGAMRVFAGIVGMDPTDREPELTPPVTGAQRAPNLTFFLTHDVPAVKRHVHDVGLLEAAADKIVPGIGARSAQLMPGRCATALSALIGVAPVEFPGGHTAPMQRPRGMAAVLLPLFDGLG